MHPAHAYALQAPPVEQRGASVRHARVDERRVRVYPVEGQRVAVEGLEPALFEQHARAALRARLGDGAEGILGDVLHHRVAGLGVGDAALLAVLAGSASYIAVPAAMRVAAPKADPGVFVTASLAITFPFNLLAGIALYTAAAQWLWR